MEPQFQVAGGNSPSSGLTLRSAGRALGLLGLLDALCSSLLLLTLLDGLRASGRACLRAHRAALLDHIERSTDNGTLGLDLATTAGLGLLLVQKSDRKHIRNQWQ